jgi:ATP-dependent RNA helicase DeaD
MPGKKVTVGKIDLMKSFSFFEVDPTDVLDVINSITNLKMDGRRIFVEQASERDQEGGGEQREKKRPFNKERRFGAKPDFKRERKSGDDSKPSYNRERRKTDDSKPSFNRERRKTDDSKPSYNRENRKPDDAKPSFRERLKKDDSKPGFKKEFKKKDDFKKKKKKDSWND